ncbi:MAG: hypothetical protein ACHQRM_16475 [Bacteroidia bacterium]
MSKKQKRFTTATIWKNLPERHFPDESKVALKMILKTMSLETKCVLALQCLKIHKEKENSKKGRKK